MRIAFTSTMSCGKTTIVNELAKLPEFKDYKIFTERSKYLRDLGIPLNTDSTLKGQSVFLSERCAELMHENMLTDRSIIDVISFTLNAKSIEPSDKYAFEAYASRFIKEYDYIFYVSPVGVAIEDNGIRTIDSQYRTTIDNTIKSLITTHLDQIKNIGIISGTTEERIKSIKSYLSM